MYHLLVSLIRLSASSVFGVMLKAIMPFSFAEAKNNCKTEPKLRVQDQYEFEKELVEKWLNGNDRESRSGKNPRSIANLKHLKEKTVSHDNHNTIKEITAH
ncbi:MAG: hypothetical protein B2I17_04935 [Thermoplasmatales archaeon B_DKE]|nr:MAG: hypothetical protein B2I17_04935 [Thermoplasmatales archaeon B_DKE]